MMITEISSPYLQVISGLFAIFYDGDDYFRVKNIPDTLRIRGRIVLGLCIMYVNFSIRRTGL